MQVGHSPTICLRLFSQVRGTSVLQLGHSMPPPPQDHLLRLQPMTRNFCNVPPGEEGHAAESEPNVIVSDLHLHLQLIHRRRALFRSDGAVGDQNFEPAHGIAIPDDARIRSFVADLDGVPNV